MMSVPPLADGTLRTSQRQFSIRGKAASELDEALVIGL